MEDDECSSGLADTACEPIKSPEDASIMTGWILLSSTTSVLTFLIGS